jgi:hypothetical protein
MQITFRVYQLQERALRGSSLVARRARSYKFKLRFSGLFTQAVDGI